MNVAVTGASGFIGRELVYSLARRGHRVIALARDPGRLTGLPCEAVRWTINDSATIDEVLGRVDAIVHLAGEPVGQGRWNDETRRRIRESRVLSTRAIARALIRSPEGRRCRALVCASASGLYGDRGDEPLTEASEPDSDFLASVVREWEGEARAAEPAGVRVVLSRFGVILGRDGGALEKMKPVVLGAGRQWVSWIHLRDAVAFLVRALEDPRFEGAYNVVAPNPVRNSELAASLARATGARLVPRAPAWVLRLALGEMSGVVLSSCRASAARAEQAGLRFEYPRLDDALAEIYPPSHRRESRFSATQFLPRPLPEVFSYFSRAENLEELTPPWLNFRIVSKSTPEITEKTLIDYRLRIHGLPVRWRSRIESWKPNESFVDTQLRGPYASWHHTHRFEAVAGGTLMHDEVFYRLPGGAPARALAEPWVRKDFERIFSYRRRRIAEALG
jgi:uncharacterized protein (TIGR01777 family)